jgi:hypothetical protein
MNYCETRYYSYAKMDLPLYVVEDEIWLHD